VSGFSPRCKRIPNSRGECSVSASATTPVEVEHGEVRDADPRPGGEAEAGAVLTAIAPAETRPEVKLIDERPLIMGR